MHSFVEQRCQEGISGVEPVKVHAGQVDWPVSGLPGGEEEEQEEQLREQTQANWWRWQWWWCSALGRIRGCGLKRQEQDDSSTQKFPLRSKPLCISSALTAMV